MQEVPVTQNLLMKALPLDSRMGCPVVHGAVIAIAVAPAKSLVLQPKKTLGLLPKWDLPNASLDRAIYSYFTAL